MDLRELAHDERAIPIRRSTCDRVIESSLENGLSFRKVPRKA